MDGFPGVVGAVSTRDKIQSYLGDCPAIILEPEMFDDAIIGIAERCGESPLVAYDRDRCIEIIMADSGCSREEAEEHYEFNIAGCWVGEGTPVFLDTRWAE